MRLKNGISFNIMISEKCLGSDNGDTGFVLHSVISGDNKHYEINMNIASKNENLPPYFKTRLSELKILFTNILFEEPNNSDIHSLNIRRLPNLSKKALVYYERLHNMKNKKEKADIFNEFSKDFMDSKITQADYQFLNTFYNG